MNKGNNLRQGLSFALRLGTELIVATLVGALIGYFLDKLFGTRPWFLAVGVLMGGAAGCLMVYRLASTMETMDVDDDKKNNDSEDI